MKKRATVDWKMSDLSQVAVYSDSSDIYKVSNSETSQSKEKGLYWKNKS